VKATGWLRGLEVTVGGAGIVSHAGLVLLRALADKTGLTAGLSRALACDRLLVHDRGRVLSDLACAIADGAEVISDFRVIGDQRELFGQVASVPTCWRALHEIASGGGRALVRVSAAVNAARRAGIEARHGALPGVRVADKALDGVTCLRLDASVVPCHSDKEGAEPNFKGFGWARPGMEATGDTLVAQPTSPARRHIRVSFMKGCMNIHAFGRPPASTQSVGQEAVSASRAGNSPQSGRIPVPSFGSSGYCCSVSHSDVGQKARLVAPVVRPA
jgi:hypothetical protein